MPNDVLITTGGDPAVAIAAIKARDNALQSAQTASSASAIATDAAGRAEARAAQLEASQVPGLLLYPTWSALALFAGTSAAQGSEVDVADTGTHTDPVTGLTVANAGRYAWSTSPAGWKRIGDSAVGEVRAMSGRTANLESRFSDDPARSTLIWVLRTLSGMGLLSLGSDGRFSFPFGSVGPEGAVLPGQTLLANGSTISGLGYTIEAPAQDASAQVLYRVRLSNGAIAAQWLRDGTIEISGMRLTASGLSVPGMTVEASGRTVSGLGYTLEPPVHDVAGTVLYRVRHADGRVIGQWLRDGTIEIGGLRVGPTEATLPGRTLRADGSATTAFGLETRPLDDQSLLARLRVGNMVVAKLGLDGTLHVPAIQTYTTATPSSFTAEDITAADAYAAAYSAGVNGRQVTAVRPLLPGLNQFDIRGQSLAVSYETHPPVMTSQRLDNKMIGGSVHAASAPWTPFGSTALSPLVATVRDSASATLLTPEQIAALTFGDDAFGETILECALDHLRQVYLDRRGLSADPSLLFLATESGQGGQPIANFVPGASANCYARIAGAMTQGKATATGASLPWQLVAWPWLQGEQDYTASGIDKATYKATFETIRAAANADALAAATAGAGDARPPACFMYQTGGAYVRQASNLAIGQAQLELALERPDVFMASPNYFVPDKGGHLTTNGARWLGAIFGKIMTRVLIDRRDWEPLHPVRLLWRARSALLAFHTPEGALQWGLPYVQGVATDYATKGFSARDDAGDIPLTSVQIAGQRVVLLAFGRDFVGTPIIEYGQQTSCAGNGCLRDSDGTVSTAAYTYLPSAGMDATENIAALVGKPYPQNNWCAHFSIAATAA